jgi:hypothetical protein
MGITMGVRIQIDSSAKSHFLSMIENSCHGNRWSRALLLDPALPSKPNPGHSTKQRLQKTRCNALAPSRKLIVSGTLGGVYQSLEFQLPRCSIQAGNKLPD